MDFLTKLLQFKPPKSGTPATSNSKTSPAPALQSNDDSYVKFAREFIEEVVDSAPSNSAGEEAICDDLNSSSLPDLLQPEETYKKQSDTDTDTADYESAFDSEVSSANESFNTDGARSPDLDNASELDISALCRNVAELYLETPRKVCTAPDSSALDTPRVFDLFEGDFSSQTIDSSDRSFTSAFTALGSPDPSGTEQPPVDEVEGVIGQLSEVCLIEEKSQVVEQVILSHTEVVLEVISAIPTVKITEPESESLQVETKFSIEDKFIPAVPEVEATEPETENFSVADLSVEEKLVPAVLEVEATHPETENFSVADVSIEEKVIASVPDVESTKPELDNFKVADLSIEEKLIPAVPEVEATEPETETFEVADLSAEEKLISSVPEVEPTEQESENFSVADLSIEEKLIPAVPEVEPTEPETETFTVADLSVEEKLIPAVPEVEPTDPETGTFEVADLSVEEKLIPAIPEVEPTEPTTETFKVADLSAEEKIIPAVPEVEATEPETETFKVADLSAEEKIIPAVPEVEATEPETETFKVADLSVEEKLISSDPEVEPTEPETENFKVADLSVEEKLIPAISEVEPTEPETETFKVADISVEEKVIPAVPEVEPTEQETENFQVADLSVEEKLIPAVPEVEPTEPETKNLVIEEPLNLVDPVIPLDPTLSEPKNFTVESSNWILGSDTGVFEEEPSFSLIEVARSAQSSRQISRGDLSLNSLKELCKQQEKNLIQGNEFSVKPRIQDLLASEARQISADLRLQDTTTAEPSVEYTDNHKAKMSSAKNSDESVPLDVKWLSDRRANSKDVGIDRERRSPAKDVDSSGDAPNYTVNSELNHSEAGPETARELPASEEVFTDSAGFDFLSAMSSSQPSRRLGLDSLYVKFDPLVSAAPVPQSKAPLPMPPLFHEDKRPSVTPATPPRNPALASIDRLISLSPSPTKQPAPPVIKQEEEPSALNAELITLRDAITEQDKKYQALLAEREKLLARTSELEAQLADAVHDADKLSKRAAERTQSQQQMSLIMEEYEKTISRLVAEKEHDKQVHAVQLETVTKDKDSALHHLSNIEIAFSDVHKKYERSKVVIDGFRKNEEALKHSLARYEDTVHKQDQKYEMLKSHAMQQLENANQELDNVRRSHQAECAKMKAMLKKSELKASSLEEMMEQKQKENLELASICDDLIAKVTS